MPDKIRPYPLERQQAAESFFAVDGIVEVDGAVAGIFRVEGPGSYPEAQRRAVESHLFQRLNLNTAQPTVAIPKLAAFCEKVLDHSSVLSAIYGLLWVCVSLFSYIELNEAGFILRTAALISIGVSVIAYLGMTWSL